MQGRDLKIYDLDFKPVGHDLPFPGIPAHWNCRSTLIVITKSYSELMGTGSPLTRTQKKELDQNSSSARASMGGRVSGLMSNDDWLRAQGNNLQDEILGITQAQLWQETKLGMANLIHQTNRPLTIQGLAARMISGK